MFLAVNPCSLNRVCNLWAFEEKIYLKFNLGMHLIPRALRLLVHVMFAVARWFCAR
jgi:hypothetical protein